MSRRPVPCPDRPPGQTFGRAAVTACALFAALVTLLLAAGGATAATAVSTSPSDPTPVTLAGNQNFDDCISALPQPGCSSRRDTDAMQVAVLVVMTAGVGLIGWRIGRAVRARDRASGPPST